jgi:hypothetical protein
MALPPPFPIALPLLVVASCDAPGLALSWAGGLPFECRIPTEPAIPVPTLYVVFAAIPAVHAKRWGYLERKDREILCSRYLHFPPRHLLEQHSLSAEQESCLAKQAHTGSKSHSPVGSEQSAPPSQSSSTPSSQMDSVDGGVPQSPAQLHSFSPGSQLPSPHTGTTAPGATSRIGEAGRPSELTKLLAAGFVLNA